MDKYVQQVHESLPSWAKGKPAKPSYYLHKVRYSGETLSIIAEWYTGDVGNWRALAKANSRLNPNHIKIGTKIRIPKNLLRTQKRMPKHFVDTFAKRRAHNVILKAPPKPNYFYHRVRYAGETLSIIAKWYTGDGENWRALSKANPKLNPNRIRVGSKIRIPAKLLNTRKPLPRSYVVLATPPPKPATSTSAKVETVEKQPEPTPTSQTYPDTEGMEIFGPK